jgi:tetratricopeptide (TPR) repeat protein
VTEQAAIREKLNELAKISCGEPHVILLLAEYVDRHPEDVVAASAYGDALRVVGRSADAVHVLKRAFDYAKNASTKASIAIRIAMTLESTAAVEAERWYASASELDQSLPGWAWILRGANLARIERFDAAIDCYGRALKSKDVDRDEALKNLALTYRALGDYGSATAYLKRALKMNPNDRELTRLKAGLDDLESTRRFVVALRSS